MAEANKPRFPAAKIKRLMQADDDVGRIAVSVPPIVSKCLELFVSELVAAAANAADAEESKTIHVSHVKTCADVEEFAFLQSTMANFSGVAVAPKRSGSRSGRGAGSTQPKKQCCGDAAESAAVDAQIAAPTVSVGAMGSGLGAMLGSSSLGGYDDNYDDE